MSKSTDTQLSAGDVKRIAEVLETLPHNAKLGIRMVELAPGRCTTYIEHRPELVGEPTSGVLHGGVVTTLIDSTAGAAVYASIPTDSSLATLDMRIDYLKPTKPDKRLYATAELYRRNRSVGPWSRTVECIIHIEWRPLKRALVTRIPMRYRRTHGDARRGFRHRPESRRRGRR